MARDIEHLMAKENPEVLQGAREKADEMRLEMRIAEIRELCNVTQAPRRSLLRPWATSEAFVRRSQR